jgi:error-prone DNA polymerase
VICRQRPGTASGFLFLTLEDETGLANAIVRPDLFQKRHDVLVRTGVLEVEGVLQNFEGVSVQAVEVRPMRSTPVPASRDFH